MPLLKAFNALRSKFVVLPFTIELVTVRLIIALFFVSHGWLGAQFSAEHSAMNNLKKGKWEKAKGQLIKSIRKDSLNPSANFALAVYFFTPANPDFQLDSAYRYNMRSLSDYQLITVKQRDRLKKIPLDSSILIHQRHQIDSAAFARAVSINTEQSYIDFLKRFPLAREVTWASELRDEVAYLDALKENTYDSFLKYLEKYPQSIRAKEAKERYEKLLFEVKTADRKLASYESFLIQYPETFYRKEVEKEIFEIMTASGETQDYENFLMKYPQSCKTRVAKNILYHLLKSDDRAVPALLLTDSIKRLQELNEIYLVPFLRDDKFGFMNGEGEEIIRPSFTQINDDYLCGNITDELLVVENKILARNGVKIFEGDIKEAEPLGMGFIKVRGLSCSHVVHYSGFILKDCFQDINVISKNYLALKKNNLWGLFAFNGRMLLDFVWDDVQQIESVLVLKKSGKYRVVKLTEISKLADQLSVPYTPEFDEIKSWSNGFISVRKGKEQGVLDQNLKEWIKTDLQEITSHFFGAVSKTPVGYKLHPWVSPSSQNFVHVKMNQPWVAVQSNGFWQLIDPATKQFESIALDTIHFNGPFAVGVKNDSSYIYLSGNSVLKLPVTWRTQFISGKDSLFFLMVEEADKKTIFDSKANTLFTVAFDKLEYNGEGFFTVTKKDKRGLIALTGKIVLQPEYDAIGTVSKGVVQVLKDKKFGSIDVIRKKEIKPEYDKNIVPYSSIASIACKGGLCGLIAWDGKPVTPLEFEEIRYWNDSSALVKKNFYWSIYNFVEKKIIMDRIKNFRWVQDSDHEKIIIVQQENNVGVISNKKGVIIPPTFTDIVNLGSAAIPLYFTEKHVEEASIYVVIYYNKEGRQLKRQVFEVDDYEKIYCSGN